MNVAIEHSELTLGQAAVLRALLSFDPKEGRKIHPGYARLCARACCSRRTLSGHLRTLQEEGWILRGKTEKGSNIYRVRVPPWAESALGQILLTTRADSASTRADSTLGRADIAHEVGQILPPKKKEEEEREEEEKKKSKARVAAREGEQCQNQEEEPRDRYNRLMNKLNMNRWKMSRPEVVELEKMVKEAALEMLHAGQMP
ncbi:MAG: hypothetical protein GTO63_31620 [Anaerolineae bacterium]|nr:hypothetical protein [Anaerolineae bacterium]NIN99237.1 hypothetical protein [Anaerolineae bacterium]NIQ82076.1 hypothetical protein [Anaerolineae bacterium]